MARCMMWAAIVVAAVAGPLLAAEAQGPVAALVAKMPADTIEDGQKIAAEIVKLGPAGVKDLARMVVPPGEGDDAKARFALNGLAYYVTRPGAEAERAMVAAALVEALAGAQQPLVKSFLVSMLQLAGKDEAVEPLAKLLADPDLCEPAAQALVRINTPGVVPALAKALPSLKYPCTVTVIKALGDLRAKPAVRVLQPYVRRKGSQEGAEHRAALDALANIGDPSTADLMATECRAGKGFELAHRTALYLKYAGRVAESGNKDLAARICREVIKQRTAPRESNMVADALATLVAATGEGAADDLLAALGSEYRPLRAAALRLLAAMPGEGVSAKLIRRLAQASGETKAELIGALAGRKDKAASAAILGAVKDKEKPVRLAALEAAGRLPAADAVPALLAALATDQADEVKAAQAVLSRMSDASVAAPAARAMAGMPTPSRVAIVEILAPRGGKEAQEAILAATEDKEQAVRLAAIKALGARSSPESADRLIDILLQTKEGPERAEAEQSLVRAGGKLSALGNPILARLPKTAGADRAALLKALGRIAGPKALEAVVADTKSADPIVQDAAIRALADWPLADAADELLKIARTAEKEAHQVIALRGYFRLAGLPHDAPAPATVRLYKEGLAVAKRPDEKRLALAGLAALRHLEALKAIASYLDDEALGADAAMAAVRCVVPQGPQDKTLAGADVVEIMKKVAAVAKDAKVREQAAAYVASQR